jgi:metal-responsive CopG/Arc/MetJ family transcriptional regulator
VSEKAKTISITVDKNLINKFSILAINQEIPRKNLIEDALKEYLVKNNAF